MTVSEYTKSGFPIACVAFSGVRLFSRLPIAHDKRHFRVFLALLFSAVLFGCSSSGSSDSGSGQQTGLSDLVFLQIPPDQQQPLFIDDAKAFNSNSPYIETLVGCAQRAIDSACTTGELPMIGQVVQQPTVDDIMNRVVLTHDWAGVRFKQILERAPANVLTLFRPVSIVYIGSDNTRVVYSFSRSRLSIDMDNLWLNAEEKSALDTSSSGGGSEEVDDGLLFEPRRRYLLGTDFAYPSRSGTSRDFDGIPFANFGDMYWSLAYANSLVPAEAFATVTPEQTVGDVMDANVDNFVSNMLYADVNLTIDDSYLFAAARAYGDDEPVEPNSFLTTISAAAAGDEMASQGKMRFFSFYNRSTDVASLFEAAMMRMNHGVYIDNALVDKFDGFEVLGCDDYKIGWGMRNRLADPLVAPRAQFVVEKILGKTAEVEQFFASGLGVATPLPAGQGWCESLDSLPPADQPQANAF